MKKIQVFLLFLIIIGLGLLATHKMWVPALVDRIISSEIKTSSLTPKEEELVLKDARQCYTYNHIGTKEEPYTVNEFIDINISGKDITGTKKGTQDGPDMTNGYLGTLSGNLDKDIINVVFSYTIEGSQNKEQEIYRIKEDKTGIEKLRYPLTEKDKMLVPDLSKEYKTMLYARVGCEGSN